MSHQVIAIPSSQIVQTDVTDENDAVVRVTVAASTVAIPTPSSQVVSVTVEAGAVYNSGGPGGGAVDSVDGRTGVVVLSDLYANVDDFNQLEAYVLPAIDDLNVDVDNNAAELDNHETRIELLEAGSGVSPATETTAGIAELATTAEALAGTDTTRIMTPADTKAVVNALIDAAPGALDTLNELAAALGDDANFSTTVTNALAGKVAKAGDTMTGDLTIDKSTGTALLVLDAASDSDYGKVLMKSAGVAISSLYSWNFIGSIGITTLYDEVHSLPIQTWTNAAAGSRSSAILDTLIVKRGTSGQTADLLAFQDQTGATLGKFGPAGRLQLPNGAAATPALYGAADADTGIFFQATSLMGFTHDGVEAWRFAHEGHFGGAGCLNPTNAWIYLGTGTGGLPDHSGGTAATRMAFKAKMDTVSGSPSQDLMQLNLNIVEGTTEETAHALTAQIDVHDTTAGTDNDTVVLNAIAQIYSDTNRHVWGHTVAMVIDSAVGTGTPVVIGSEIGIYNNSSVSSPGVGLNVATGGTHDFLAAILLTANASNTGRFLHEILINTASSSKPKTTYLWAGPCGAGNDPSGQTPILAFTATDTTGAAMILGKHTAALGMTLVANAEMAVYLKGDKFIIQYNDGGTQRWKSLTLTGTGVTWVHTTTEP